MDSSREWQLAAKMGQILYLSGTSWINWDCLNGTRQRNIVKSCRMQSLRIGLIQECVIYVGWIRCHVSAVGEEGSLKVRDRKQEKKVFLFCFYTFKSSIIYIYRHIMLHSICEKVKKMWKSHDVNNKLKKNNLFNVGYKGYTVLRCPSNHVVSLLSQAICGSQCQ